MKKLLFSLFLTSVAPVTTQAQSLAGKTLLTGNIGYNSNGRTVQTPGTTQSEALDRQFQFGVGAGYFVAEHLVLGLSGSYHFLRQTNEQPDSFDSSIIHSWETRSHNRAVGPFARYYFMLTDKMGLFGQATVSYSWGDASAVTSSSNTYHITSTGRGGMAQLTPGFVFFPSSRVGIELTAGTLVTGFSNGKSSSDSPGSITTKTKSQFTSAAFGLSQLQLGASLYLGH
ncbi:outer membrane beta-barrel protein [Hymenobacter sp. CRA2]|uniref:outer membrane beta-barrel protein n=1 Tax=Hymenobacter sp. CRA2 TaxID=1955620 RepID=UPI00098FB204|nr:outer membrane beta-barrel protein [Hymenobacter sp. CRA2]OON70872.1 hypothetical protein B0919_02370 [Hymenobacter sp. CRA2]